MNTTTTPTTTPTAEPAEPTAPPARRRYDSSLRTRRAAETRAAIVSAATQHFVTRGWARTGMREIAKAAGVAVETVYSHYSSKRKLLDAVIDEAVVGDDRAVPVAQRPEFQALSRGRRPERIRAAAQLTATIHARTAPFAALLREAAPTDGEIAEVLRATRERQRADVAAGLALVLDRPPTDEERDGVWAILSPEVFLLLVEQSGWTADRYEQWLATTLLAVVPRG